MQNLLALSFDDQFARTNTDARVKRLRLRFDGYVYSPKLVYSIQLGFTGYDAEPLPNGNMNIVRDAIAYYVPSPKWNIGFGQTKIKANRIQPAQSDNRRNHPLHHRAFAQGTGRSLVQQL